jgi:hypothetical protein
MNLQDFEYLSSNLDSASLFGSDSSIANLFLLQEKYNTELKIQKNILLRYYYGVENRSGYGFPLPMKNAPENWLKTALELIFDDAQAQNRPVRFCMITGEQKTLINDCLAKHFPNRTIAWKTNRNDCDYIYLRSNLADLPGSQYQKKRNHISRFNRTYGLCGTDWEFKSYPDNDIAADILTVSQKWYEEKNGESEEVLRLEHQSIELALQNSELLNLRGGVLYIKGQPAAMTLAAPISPDVLDVIYEKSFGEYEHNGAYAVINQQFARRCTSFLYLNREEDMGVEGLRKAKLSYKPEMILEKFYGELSHA